MSTLSVSAREYRRQLLLLFVVGCAVVFFYNGHRALYDTSEARYAEVAREMVASGDWMVPQLLGVPHLTKPPVGYWLVAVPIKLLGTSEWVVRLAPGLFFLLTVLMTAEIARVVWGSSCAGVIAGWLQLCAVFPLAAAQVVTTDVFLTAFETAGALCIFKCLLGVTHLRGWQLAMGAVWGLAFLTKGPPGLLGLAGFAVAAGLTRRDFAWRRVFSVVPLVAFLLVALPWYLWVITHVPGAWETWRRETFVHALEEPDRQIARSEYLLILSAGALPGTLALLYALLWKWRFSFARQRNTVIPRISYYPRPSAFLEQSLFLWSGAK